jgi:WD40 repeat protein
VFSPDTLRVITATGHSADVWDVTTGGMPVALEHTGPIKDAAFSADGKQMITASADETARVWDATTGKPVTAPLAHHGSVTAVAFSADRTRVVTASEDGTARVWDAETGRPVTAPLEHPDSVTSAAFSPDGTRVLTTSRDGRARVWTLGTDEGSAADWSQRARCGPFTLINNVPAANPEPARSCARATPRRTAP